MTRGCTRSSDDEGSSSPVCTTVPEAFIRTGGLLTLGEIWARGSGEPVGPRGAGPKTDGAIERAIAPGASDGVGPRKADG